MAKTNFLNDIYISEQAEQRDGDNLYLTPKVVQNGKNLIVNPCFVINQRNQTSYTTANTKKYCVDRWVMWQASNAATTASQTLSYTATSASSLGQISYTATTSIWTGLMQFIQNPYWLSGKKITVSINGHVESGGKIAIVVGKYASGASTSSTNPTIINTDTYNTQYITSTTDTTLSITTTIPTLASGERLCILVWSATANKLIYPSWIKMELGDTATPFEPPSYPLDLLECERCFQKLGYTGNGLIATGFVYNTTTYKNYQMFFSTTVPFMSTPELCLEYETPQFYARKLTGGYDEYTSSSYKKLVGDITSPVSSKTNAITFVTDSQFIQLSHTVNFSTSQTVPTNARNILSVVVQYLYLECKVDM